MAGGGIGKLASAGLSAATSGKGGSSGGGISPQQAALAQYQAGQQELASNAKFGGSGTGMSTMSTYENAGANLGGAMAAATEADTNLSNQNAITQAQQSQLQQIAGNNAFSQGANSFGNQTGNFGSTPSSTG